MVSNSTNTHIVRTIAGASIGNVLEWYDFGVYAFFAVIISKVIFGGFLASILLTFLAYGIGFVLRPIGSMYFGYLGDKAGRKKALLLTFWIMGIGTVATGIIPSYAVIGILAPIFLTIARMVQGFGAGGEWGGAGVYLTEMGGTNRRGFYGSLQQVFVLASVLVGLITGLTIGSMQSAFVDSVGWRIPFIVGGLLIIPLAYYLRQRLPETMDFEKTKSDKKLVKNPIVKAFTKDLKPTIIILLGTAAVTAQFYVLVEYMPTYIETETHLGTLVAFLAPIVIEAVMLPSIAFFGYLSDRIMKRKLLFWIGTLVLVLIAYPEFRLIQSGVVPAIYAFSAIVGVLEGIGAGTLVSFIGENFPTNDRYSGYIAYNLAASYFGGFGPVISIALIAALHSGYAPVLWLGIVGIISLVVILFSKETGHLKTLPEEESLYAKTSIGEK